MGSTVVKAECYGAWALPNTLVPDGNEHTPSKQSVQINIAYWLSIRHGLNTIQL
jgi:hypothetical protein